MTFRRCREPSGTAVHFAWLEVTASAPASARRAYERTNFCNEGQSGDTNPRLPPADIVTSAT